MKRVYRQLRNHTGGDTPEATFRRLVGKQAEARFIAPASGPLVVREGGTQRVLLVEPAGKGAR